MKASRYNFFIEEDNGGILAYNALSGALASIDRELYGLFLEACSKPYMMEICQNPVEDRTRLHEMISNFQKGGFLIRDDINEIDLLKKKQYQRRFFQKNTLTVTVAPTLDCNFGCIYCYEEKSGKKQYMTRETADHIIRYIDDFFSGGNELIITWFGGEPALALDIIYYISDKVMDIAVRKQINYFSSIVTNGYLLDEKTASELKGRGVKDACITIDGCPQAHNGRRPLKNGEGTFETIMGNIRRISGIMNVSIRFNVDRDNINEYSGFLDILEELGLAGKVGIEVVMIEAYPYSCEPVKRRALSTREFSMVYMELMKMAVERNFRADLFPPAYRSACSAIAGNNLVVGPEGELHKCLNSLGRDCEAYGNIREPTGYNTNLVKWLEHFPLENEKCQSCRVLPLCMGGCSRNVLLKETAPINTEGCCMQFKYNIEQLIKLKYRQYKILSKGDTPKEAGNVPGKERAYTL